MVKRQLAAIMFADMVGYTRLMQENEKNAMANRDSYRKILKKETENHSGTILQFYGDGTLCHQKMAAQQESLKRATCKFNMADETEDAGIDPSAYHHLTMSYQEAKSQAYNH